MDKTEEQGEPEARNSPVREAILDTVGGAIRIAGGMVQMAVGMTRLLAAVVLRGAAVAEGAVEATDRDGENPEPSST
jgi:hypothetical protein